MAEQTQSLKVVAIAALAILALTSDGHAVSGVFGCQVEREYRLDANGELTEDRTTPLPEILFDVHTGHMVEKYVFGDQTRHNRETFQVIGTGEPIDSERRHDVTAYKVIPERGESSGVVWHFSIVFFGQRANFLLVKRQSVQIGGCHEL